MPVAEEGSAIALTVPTRRQIHAQSGQGTKRAVNDKPISKRGIPTRVPHPLKWRRRPHFTAQWGELHALRLIQRGQHRWMRGLHFSLCGLARCHALSGTVEVGGKAWGNEFRADHKTEQGAEHLHRRKADRI